MIDRYPRLAERILVRSIKVAPDGGCWGAHRFRTFNAEWLPRFEADQSFRVAADTRHLVWAPGPWPVLPEKDGC